MVAAENWATFHDKFCSDDFRRSSSHDRSSNDNDDNNFMLGKIVKKLSTRKLAIDVDDIKNNSSLHRSAPSNRLSTTGGLQRSGSSKLLSASSAGLQRSGSSKKLSSSGGLQRSGLSSGGLQRSGSSKLISASLSNMRSSQSIRTSVSVSGQKNATW